MSRVVGGEAGEVGSESGAEMAEGWPDQGMYYPVFTGFTGFTTRPHQLARQRRVSPMRVHQEKPDWLI